MAPLAGVHRVRKTLSNGWRAEYWYAWRGGPSILVAKGANAAALKREIMRLGPQAAAQLSKLKHPKKPEGLLSGLIYAYQASPEFAKKAPRTQSDLKKHLAAIKDHFGDMETKALEAPDVAEDILEWRDTFADRPRTADHYMSAFDGLLAWGRKRNKTKANPIPEWERLYSVDRSEIVWEPAELVALCAAGSPALSRAVRVAVYSGLRLGDLLALSWFEVQENHIYTVTRKRKRGALIPITPELREVLEECARAGRSGKVLTDATGQGWHASTLAKHFRIARAKAKVSGKRWHDFRGTFITHAAKCGFHPHEIAGFVGWSLANVENIIRRYVTADAVSKAAVARFTAADVSR